MKLMRLILLLLFSGVVSVHAQRHFVTADVETGESVARVNVQGNGFYAVTDSMGCFTVPDSIRTLLFSHVNYESRIVNIDDVAGDTIFIISKLLHLDGVVVFGRGKAEDDRLRELNKSLRMARTEAQLAAADPSQFGISLSLLGKLIPKKWRRGYKKERYKKQHDDILREY